MVEGLCMTHSAYVFGNMTTNEAMHYRRYEYFRHPQSNHYYNPFNQGLLRNFFDFFHIGPNSLDYSQIFTVPDFSLTPVSPSSSGAHSHTHNPHCNHSHGRKYEVV